MFKTLDKDFIREPVLEMNITEPTDDIVLFGKNYKMYKDDWKHHVHLKCTNRCDAHCAFCIEHASKADRENPQLFLDNTRSLLQQLSDAGHFRTLSVTGGEPTAFLRLQEVVDMANEFKPLLFSINSNGSGMLSNIKERTFNGWLDLSKHSIDDRHIFKRNLNVDREHIMEFKSRQPDGKVRIQCVLGVAGGLETIEDIDKFIDYFKGAADNFSFRSLIIEEDHDKVPALFKKFRNMMFDGGMTKQQVVQDYYVYETYDYKGADVTVSWSNMAQLRTYNETHPDERFLEEIIVHPDGMITGSWNKKTLVIKEAV